MPGKQGQGKKVARPYGLSFKVKGSNGPINTEKWYTNSSDRNREFASLKNRFGTNLLSSKKLGK